MASFVTKGLASLVVATTLAQAQLWDQVIETSYGPVQGYQYFNQSTLEAIKTAGSHHSLASDGTKP
jgi:carboxylesterase 2